MKMMSIKFPNEIHKNFDNFIRCWAEARAFVLGISHYNVNAHSQCNRAKQNVARMTRHPMREH